MNWQENASLEQIKKKIIITTENKGITSETEAKSSQYILAVGKGGSKERKFISKPLGIGSSLLILHLLYFPGDRMTNKIPNTGSSVSY